MERGVGIMGGGSEQWGARAVEWKVREGEVRPVLAMSWDEQPLPAAHAQCALAACSGQDRKQHKPHTRQHSHSRR